MTTENNRTQTHTHFKVKTYVHHRAPPKAIITPQHSYVQKSIVSHIDNQTTITKPKKREHTTDDRVF